MRIGDYELIEKAVSNLNNNVQHRWRCVICGHEKVDSLSNVKKSHSHNSKTCKSDYARAEILGKIYGDFKCIEVTEKYIKLTCNYCGCERTILNGYKVYKDKYKCSCPESRLKENASVEIIEEVKLIGSKTKMFKVRCKTCGVVKYVSSGNLNRVTHGIGCILELRKQISPEVRHKLHGSWNSIKVRCGVQQNYINIENRFNDYVQFLQTMIPLVNEYLERHPDAVINNLSVDRIDVHGHYEPGNVRIASPKLQACNTTRSRKFILHNLSTGIKYISNSTRLAANTFGLNIRSLGNVIRKSAKTCQSSNHTWFEAFSLTNDEYEMLIKTNEYEPLIYEE